MLVIGSATGQRGNPTRARLLLLTIAVAAGFLYSGVSPGGDAGAIPPEGSSVSAPSFVLLIVVDQLPQQRWWGLLPRLGSDGFARIVREGRVYLNAHHDHATTLTAVGHADIVTGRLPRDHGVVANEWIDRRSGARVYSVGSRQEPTPETLLTETIGDRIVEGSGGAARVWAVSIKDRAAVILAGRRGRAFWYERATGWFRTRPDDPAPPEWVRAWTGMKESAAPASRFVGSEWSLRKPRSSYAGWCPSEGRCADPESAVSSWVEDAGSFPKKLPADVKETARQIRQTPFGDRMTLALVLDLIANEGVGAEGRPAPDLLAVSFSATDYIGHKYGPDSIEYEDQLLQLDSVIADLLRTVDERIGLGRTLVILSSDHGVDSATAYHRRVGLQSGRLLGLQLVARLNVELRERFGVEADLIQGYFTPGFYLDGQKISSAGLDRGIVAEELAGLVARRPGVGSVYVWGADGPVRRAGTTTWYDGLVADSFYRERSGDVIIVPEPYVFLDRDDEYAAMHGTPYEYDTGVPLVLMGPGIEPGHVAERVTPRQLAATIAEAIDLSSDPSWAPALP